MRITSLFFAFLVTLMPSLLRAQDPIPGNYRDNFIEGNRLIEENNWPMALLYFSEAFKVDSSNANINYKMGLCFLNSNSQKPLALPYLRKSVKDITRNYDEYEPREKKAPEPALYYLGQAYHLNNQFDSAQSYFETYKALIGLKNPMLTQDINMRIQWCQNAKEFIQTPLPVSITNMGDSINCALPDYSPVITIDESTIFFTTRRVGEKAIDGQYYEDIMMCEKKTDGTWTTARPVSPYINTPTNEASISLSTDGNIMFIYKDVNGGDIYTTGFFENEWSAPAPLGSDINTKYWETHACLTADGNTLYFVSDRPGGLGGRDIYRCVRLPNGKWSKALNLGPEINTAQDEDSPFMHPDQQTLFFASKGHKSMGGFDIFFTSKNDSGRWDAPINMGYPLNTADDDVFYMTSADGKRAYFSSVREGGYGEKDIYMAELEQPRVQPLTLLKGRIYNANGRELTQRVEINVTNTNTGELMGLYKPSARSGNFTIILPPGATYLISYIVDDKEYSNEILDVPIGSGFEEIERSIDLRDLVLGNLGTDVPIGTDTSGIITFAKDSSNLPVEVIDRSKMKNWKEMLTSSKNLSFSMYFKYNISRIDPADPDFQQFIDSCVAHINRTGSINFRVTASASQVPTKKFATNKDLSKDRAAGAQEVIMNALRARGIKDEQVQWVTVTAVVLGPTYKADFLKRKVIYERYQYVKIRGF
ncbi:MAG: hypothetical protein ACRCYO_09150 [Bacteroidia bacterium]